MLKIGAKNKFALVIGEINEIDEEHNTMRIRNESQSFMIKYLDMHLNNICRGCTDPAVLTGLKVLVAGKISNNKRVDALNIFPTEISYREFRLLNPLISKIMGYMGV